MPFCESTRNLALAFPTRGSHYEHEIICFYHLPCKSFILTAQGFPPCVNGYLKSNYPERVMYLNPIRIGHRFISSLMFLFRNYIILS